MQELKFTSLSVLDFVSESKEWEVSHLVANAELHKMELKKILSELASNPDKSSLYLGLQLEIEHLEHFIRQLCWLITTDTKPACVDKYKGDVEQIISICDHFPETKHLSKLLK